MPNLGNFSIKNNEGIFSTKNGSQNTLLLPNSN